MKARPFGNAGRFTRDGCPVSAAGDSPKILWKIATEQRRSGIGIL